MIWSRFAKILQTKPLDRETKLMLIDLLAKTTDPKLEKEILTFVFAWEEAEAQTQKELIEGVKRITDEYVDDLKALNTTTKKELLSVADDLQRQKHIEDLRKSIQDL